MITIISDYRKDNNRYYSKKRDLYSAKQSNAERSKFKKLHKGSNKDRHDNKNTRMKISQVVESVEEYFTYHGQYLVSELCNAIRENNVELLSEILLDEVRDLVDKCMNSFTYYHSQPCPSITPLMCATEIGHDECVRYLLEKRFNVNANCKFENYRRNSDDCYLWSLGKCDCRYCFVGTGRTALWLACYNGHLNVVRTLVEIGHADVNISDSKRWTPLRAAILKNHLNIVEYLLEETAAIIDGRHDLYQAIETNNVQLVEYLLSKGCDPNIRFFRDHDDDDDQYIFDNWDSRWMLYSPLHFALGHIDEPLQMVKCLLDYSADPTLFDCNENTVLHIAINQGKSQVVKLILDYGFTHDQKDYRFMTPLMRATERQQPKIIDLLCAAIPRQQYINEMMFLASFYQLTRYPIERVLECYQKAFHLQPQNLNNSTPCEAYEFRRECQTFDELLIIRNDAHAMKIQALLVYDRLCSHHSERRFLASFLIQDMYDIYANTGQFDQCLTIVMYGYNLSLSCDKCWAEYFVSRCIDKIIDTIGDLFRIGNLITVKRNMHLFEWILNKSDDSYAITRLCSYMFHLFNSDVITQEEKQNLVRFLQQSMRSDYTKSYPYSYEKVFHWALELSGKEYSLEYPKIDEHFIRFMVACGANVNELVKSSGQRPLHIIAKASNIDCAVRIVKILLEAGAHTDCLDSNGFLPEQRARSIEIESLLRSTRTHSLKCLCAHLILSKKLHYQLHLPSSLIDFVRMHKGAYTPERMNINQVLKYLQSQFRFSDL